MSISDYGKQKELVLSLAKQVADIAALPIQQKTLKEWKALNPLKPVRPMFMMDQLPWEQMQCDELKCECEDGFLWPFEYQLREILYRWKYIQDDKVIFPTVRMYKSMTISTHGIESKLKRLEKKTAQI